MMFLKASHLNALLTQHLSTHVSGVFISDTRGALIAYSSPDSPMALRMHATMAGSVWSAYAALVAAGTISKALATTSESHATDESPENDRITKLTLELSDCRFCVSQLQCGLLVGLVGSTPWLMQGGGSSIDSSSPQPQRASLTNGFSGLGSADGASIPSRGSSSGHSRHEPNSTETAMPSEQLLKRRITLVVQHLDEELAEFTMPASTESTE
ncbi:MAG: hypothetical protein M1823_004908 [Watsoniomyces obsoletus]|nr:MAG: hypothetical protein M1823_004908 [Watsoniomyces obsoletus]